MSTTNGRELPPQPLLVLTEDEQLFRDNIRKFAEESIRPLVREMDERGSMDHSLIEQFHQLGLMGIEIPEQYGGAGGTFFEAILAVEELSRVDPSVGVLVDVQNTLVNNALIRWGTEAQKQKYLPKMAGEWVGSYALSEAGSGSDAFALQTRAEDKGDHWLLNGQKLWITNGKESNLFHHHRHRGPCAPATRELPPSSSRRTFLASASARRKISSASAPPAPPN